ncbi:hypothetical protein AMAG_17876 [Allomyces macrogynus ATCC 38327]|uniref:CKK domain-containing protein n=1 Tax=Allomyces macrogynus (strain ATCC 38327) TaxID=578462 RepID=A0A0L0S0K4_ALLM3|nr:hypothetical protein AMAG_17876 [Allomyces macrogynus ATCC 38327]|eukprot:KNE56152.1 hypothetical protein AMAG_17876 [Allomyces macrogynus ATCC 38327]
MSSFHAVSPVPVRGIDSVYASVDILDSPSVRALNRPPSVMDRPPSVLLEQPVSSAQQLQQQQSDSESGHDGFDLDAYLVHPVAPPEPPTEGRDASPAVDEDAELESVGQEEEEMEDAAAGGDLIRDLEVFVDDLLDCYDGSDNDERPDWDADGDFESPAHQLVTSGLGGHFVDADDRDVPTPSQRAPSTAQDATRLPVAAAPVDPPHEIEGSRLTWASRSVSRASLCPVSCVQSPAMSRAASRAMQIAELRAESRANLLAETRAMSRVASHPVTALADHAAALSVLELAALGPVTITDSHGLLALRSGPSSQLAGSSIGSWIGTSSVVEVANGAAEAVDSVPVASNAVPVAPPPQPAQPSRPTTASTTLLFHNEDFDPERAKKRINRLRQRLATPTSAPNVADKRIEMPVPAPGGSSVHAAHKAGNAAPSEPTTPRTGGTAAKIKEQQRKIMSERNLGKSKKSTNIIDRNVKNSSASRRSNKKLIVNALNMCLSGPVNEKMRTEVLEDLERSDQTNFVVLLRGPKNHSFKGLYVHVVDQNQIIKLYGNGPLEIEQADVSEFFKYDSGSRSFKPIPTRSFSTFVHGMAVQAAVKH